jgi:hypothetical protein
MSKVGEHKQSESGVFQDLRYERNWKDHYSVCDEKYSGSKW